MSARGFDSAFHKNEESARRTFRECLFVNAFAKYVTVQNITVGCTKIFPFRSES